MQSRQAYQSGDGAAAKELSNQGKTHDAKAHDFNRQASDYIFRENNAPGRVDPDSIDLHGQFVDEAERVLEERIRADQARGQTHLHAIVGKGNHSAGHVQKIRPKVEALCRELGLKCRTEENTGRIYINLQGGEPLPPQPHHEEHPAGQQHPHHGGHPAGQQPQDETPVWEKLLPRVLQTCCVVM